MIEMGEIIEKERGKKTRMVIKKKVNYSYSSVKTYFKEVKNSTNEHCMSRQTYNYCGHYNIYFLSRAVSIIRMKLNTSTAHISPRNIYRSRIILHNHTSTKKRYIIAEYRTIT